MTYEFAVWDGAQPLSNAHAASEHNRLKSSVTVGKEPTESIQKLVADLGQLAPTPGDAVQGPWVDYPLIDQANGPFLTVRVYERHALQVRDLLISKATDKGIVLFDPQLSELVPSAVDAERTTMFQLPQQRELGMHLGALMSEHVAKGESIVGVVEHIKSEFYLQWLVDASSITVEVRSDASLPEDMRLSMAARDRMLALGFHISEPNWSQQWESARGSIEAAVQAITNVIYDVREFQPGDGIGVQTFPVS